MLRRATTLLVAVALTAAGCGSTAAVKSSTPSSASPHELISASADATKKAGTARMTMAMTMKLGTQGDVQMTATGGIDFRSHRGSMRFGIAAPGEGAQAFDMVIDGKTVYVKMPAASGAATWVKMDMRALNGSVGGNWFGSQNDPAQVIDYLRGAPSSIVRVGDETVRGVATTHYTATVEFERIIASAPAANREAMRKALAPLTAAGIKSMPIEAWVDRDGLVRREDVHMSVDNTLMAGMDMTMRVELFDFGAPLRITVPEGRNVVDYSALSGA